MIGPSVAVVVAIALIVLSVAGRLRKRASAVKLERLVASATGKVGRGTPDLRLAVLQRTMLADRLATGPSDEPVALVMDWALGDALATLVSFDDDTTSLYLSTGGGVIGAGAHESVRVVAKAFREAGTAARSAFSIVLPTDPFTPPRSGMVTFYLVTTAATLRAGPIGTDTLMAAGSPLALLGNRAQTVIGAIRQVSPA